MLGLGLVIVAVWQRYALYQVLSSFVGTQFNIEH